MIKIRRLEGRRFRGLAKSLCTIAILIIVLGITACFVPSCAAQTQTVQTQTGSALKQVINETLIPLLVSVVGALLSIVLVKIKEKLNLNISEEKEEWINRLAENAVQFVAEKTAAMLKINSISFTSNEKLETAIAYLIARVPKLTRDQADQYIHAAIARIPGAGATNDRSLIPGI